MYFNQYQIFINHKLVLFKIMYEIRVKIHVTLCEYNFILSLQLIVIHRKVNIHIRLMFATMSIIQISQSSCLINLTNTTLVKSRK